MNHAIADGFSRNRKSIAVCFVALTALAAWGLSRLQYDDRPRSIFISDDDDYRLLTEVFADFGSDDNDCFVVVESQDLFTPEALAALAQMSQRFRAIDGVTAVRGIADAVVFEPGSLPRPLLPEDGARPEDYEAARAAATSHPLLANRLISADAGTTLVVVRLASDLTSVKDFEPIVERMRAVATDVARGGRLRVRLTGLPPVRVEMYNALQADQTRFMLIGSLLGAAIAMFLLRRAAAVGIVSVAALCGAFWAIGAMGVVGEDINIVNNVIMTLVLVIGFADAIHLMHDMRQARAAGVQPRDASAGAVGRLAGACALTSLTTAIGFGSLAVAKVDIIRRFGLACAGGTLLALLAVVVLVPLLGGTRLGRWIQPHTSRTSRNRLGNALGALSTRVTRHARLVAVVGLLLTLGLFAASLRLTPNSWLRESLPIDSEAAEALMYCDRKFGGVLEAYVLVEWEERLSLADDDVLRGIGAAQVALGAHELINYPVSVLNLLDALPAAVGDRAARAGLLPRLPTDIVRRFVREDRRRALIAARVPDVGTGTFEPIYAELRTRLRALEGKYPGMRFRLTGTSLLATNNLNSMIGDLARSLGLAAVVIFVVLTIALRSLRYGLISILPNAFPLVVTSAWLWLSGRQLQLISVIVFSIALGIAVDDTIHFLVRFRRELAVDGNVKDAVRRTFLAVGAAMVTTTAVLVGGFGPMMFSSLPAVRVFAELSCVAIVSALAGDLIILPALLACFVRSGRDVPAVGGGS